MSSFKRAKPQRNASADAQHSGNEIISPSTTAPSPTLSTPASALNTASCDSKTFQTARALPAQDKPSEKSHTEPVGPSTKSGLGGLTLISTGLDDLDKLLGGGVPLGSLTLLCEDVCGKHHATLLKYFTAEGIVTQQQVLHSTVCPDGLESLSQQLPKPVDRRAARVAQSAVAASEHSQHELKIAWQYRRYIKNKEISDTRAPAPSSSFTRAPSSTTAAPAAPRLAAWAHGFDLTKVMPIDTLRRSAQIIHSVNTTGEHTGMSAVCQATWDLVNRVTAVSCGAASATLDTPVDSSNKASDGHTSCDRAQHSAATSLPTFSPLSVGRVALTSLGGTDWEGCGSDGAGSALLATFLTIKALLRDSRCAAFVSVPTHLYTALLRAQLCQVADIVLQLRSVADDSSIVRLSPEPQSCAGVLRIVKFTVPGMLSLPHTGPMLTLIRHKRTRLEMVPIEIDPDAEMAEMDAESSLAGTASTVLCSSRPDKDILAF